MKKLQQRSKLNNGGFSLVELIIVVAIMAVLIGVLAPQYLRYVDKTRKQKDESAGEEIRHAVEIAIADENIYKNLIFTSNKVTVTFTDTTNEFTVAAEDGTALKDELTAVIGGTDFTSKDYKGKNYVVTIDNSGTATTVTGAFN